MTVMNDDRRSDHFRVNLRQGLFGFISRPPRLFGCGDRQHARPLRRDDSLPQCSDTALGGWQNRAMPCGIKITEPRGSIITHLGESLIDEAEVRCLSFRAGNQARRRCSRCRPRTAHLLRRIALPGRSRALSRRATFAEFGSDNR